jgi:tetratricopeptide (TPR) repeat protein
MPDAAVSTPERRRCGEDSRRRSARPRERPEYRRRVSPRTRIWLIVAALALAAAGATVGVTVLTRTGSGETTRAARVQQKGRPPLLLDLGVRTDPEATALRGAVNLYADGHVQAAAAVFHRYRSLEAQVGSALTDWPSGFDRLGELVRVHPRSSLAQLTLGTGLFWRGRLAEAQAAWRKAKTAQPDTAYAVRAGDLLHPRDAPGLPQFVPSFPAPGELARLSPVEQYAFLRARARTGGAHAKLLYGVELQNLGRPVSAEREFAAASALAPHDPDAQVAAAVGLFDKDRPAVAFSRLGPLVRIFPRAITVRFHLGLMLIWIGQLQEARVQLQQVVHAGPSPFLADARQLIGKLPGK